ncbi:MAG: hypothetical protein P4L99_01585 [Chthoniobacter sp.]|nr:hypothetical protein [Chthoniobacter sp.]
MKNVEFKIVDGNNHPLHEPATIERETDLPVALMEAVNDFLEAYHGELALPLRIEVTVARKQAA